MGKKNHEANWFLLYLLIFTFGIILVCTWAVVAGSFLMYFLPVIAGAMYQCGLAGLVEFYFKTKKK